MGILYESIPSQLALKKKKFTLSFALNKRPTKKDSELLADLIDSKIVLVCYNVKDPNRALMQPKDLNDFKLYLSDVGLFTTMLFNEENNVNDDIYNKLLSDKVNLNFGYLYDNCVAQIIKASGKNLYFHTWPKKDSTHYYEIDFLLPYKGKIIPVEVKSGQTKHHHSIDAFNLKYSSHIDKSVILSNYDVKNEKTLLFKPFYLLPYILEEKKTNNNL